MLIVTTWLLDGCAPVWSLEDSGIALLGESTNNSIEIIICATSESTERNGPSGQLLIGSAHMWFASGVVSVAVDVRCCCIVCTVSPIWWNCPRWWAIREHRSRPALVPAQKSRRGSRSRRVASPVDCRGRRGRGRHDSWPSPWPRDLPLSLLP